MDIEKSELFWGGADPRPFTLPLGAVYDLRPAAYEELCEGLYYAEEHLGEIVCQHRSETAGFGDSWPGAQLEILALERSVRRQRAVVAGHPSAGSPPAYVAPAVDAIEDDDIPF